MPILELRCPSRSRAWRENQPHMMLPLGQRVDEVRTDGDAFIIEWNTSSARPFPDKTVTVGDTIVQCNDRETPRGIWREMQDVTIPRRCVIARFCDG